MVILLHCTLASCGAVYCNWSCLWVCVFVGVCVCGSVTTITQNCVHRSSPNRVLGKSTDRLQLIKFWSSCSPGRRSVAGQNFLAPPYYNQRTAFVSLGTFFIYFVFILHCITLYVCTWSPLLAALAHRIAVLLP